MDILPNDVIVHIISRLETPSDVINFGRTCKKYHELSKHDKIWTTLYQRVFPIFCEIIEHTRNVMNKNLLEVVSKGHKRDSVESKQVSISFPNDILETILACSSSVTCSLASSILETDISRYSGSKTLSYCASL